MKISFFSIGTEKFIENLPVPTREKVTHTIELLEHFGHQIGMPHSKRLQKNLYELRNQGSPSIRIMYTFYGEGVLILHAFSKKTQKTPSQEVEIALKRLRLLQTK